MVIRRPKGVTDGLVAQHIKPWFKKNLFTVKTSNGV